MPTFLLQNNALDRIGRLVVPCADFARARGHEIVDRSFSSSFAPETLDVDETSGVLVYGSVGWAKRIKDSRFSRWIDYDDIAFAASTWVPLFGERALNSGGFLVSDDELFGLLADGGRYHVRPDADDKAFVGGVYDAASWAVERARVVEERGAWRAGVGCWTSPLKPIDAEYRCWFVDGELVEVSLYRDQGRAGYGRVVDPQILDRIRSLADAYLPVANVVMDVAASEGALKTIEFNPIHCCGWYAADVPRILDAWTASLALRPVPSPTMQACPASS